MGTIDKEILQNDMATVHLYDTIKNLGYILGQTYSIEIIFLLSQEPMRNKQLKTLLKCKDNTLARRLHALTDYGIIKKLPVTWGNKKTHEYTITNLGQELIRFFRGYDRKRLSGGT